MIWLKTWWPGLLVLVAGLAILGYGAWKKHEGKEEVKQEVKIERLEGNNKALTDAAAIRRKQNEILVNDITPDAFSSILRDGRY